MVKLVLQKEERRRKNTMQRKKDKDIKRREGKYEANKKIKTKGKVAIPTSLS